MKSYKVFSHHVSLVDSFSRVNSFHLIMYRYSILFISRGNPKKDPTDLYVSLWKNGFLICQYIFFESEYLMEYFTQFNYLLLNVFKIYILCY